ncbi:MAG: hypothetical protein ACREDX_11815 [Aestuariivirga sp.]
MTTRHNDCFEDLLARQPERLVITGFRSCMAGYDFCDVACWEAAWQSYIGELGARRACCLMGELQYWVRNLRWQAQRAVSYFPQGCRHLCHDECMALSVVSAAQGNDTNAGCLAIQHLIGSSDRRIVDDVWTATRSFADALTQSDQPLYPVSATVVESIAKMNRLVNVQSKYLH